MVSKMVRGKWDDFFVQNPMTKFDVANIGRQDSQSVLHKIYWLLAGQIHSWPTARSQNNYVIRSESEDGDGDKHHLLFFQHQQNFHMTCDFFHPYTKEKKTKNNFSSPFHFLFRPNEISGGLGDKESLSEFLFNAKEAGYQFKTLYDYYDD